MSAAPTAPGPGVSWWRGHQRLVDAVVALALLLLQLLGLLLYREDPFGYVYRRPDLLGVLLAAAAVVPLWWRHRAPAAVAVVTALVGTGMGVLGYAGIATTFVVLVAVYTTGAESPLARSLPATLVGAACSAGYVLWLRTEHPQPEVLDAVQVVAGPALLLALWGVGRGVRSRRLYTRELEQRAERLERTRAAEVRAALAEERGRIARELHDVVAHHVAVMTVQAAAARRTVERDPAGSVQAMASVESTGRAALAEMRRLVELLRGPDAADPPVPSLAPTPGLADLDRLVEQVRDAGLPVELRCTGSPRPLPAGLDLAIFRAVQEALTNTLKHAGPTRAEVELDWDEDVLRLRIRDRGRGPAPRDAPEIAPPGLGLLGLRERLALYGGRVSAGPARGGGFEVTATIPLEAPPASLAG